MRNVHQYSRQEFIGRLCEVVDAGHQGYLGMKGLILDETRGTLLISTAAGERCVPKPGNTFRITFDGKEVTLNGREIAFRPEERTKKAKVN